jgi:glycosyltransferase involved in cell wall biosynthesis
VLNARPPEMTPELRSLAADFEEFDHLPSGPIKFPWMLYQSWRICRKRKPEMLICWANGFAPWILLGARMGGVRRLVTHAGNPPTLSAKGRMQTAMSTFAARVTGGRMVCCSHYVAGQFALSPGSVSSVLRVVYNCARLRVIAEAATESRSKRLESRPRLIMVATLERHKDHDTLVRAMPQILAAVPDAELLLAGDGVLRPDLVRLCASLGLGEAVTFLGSRNDVPSLLGQSDVFVFSTTREEGLGTVLIEALAAGLPIVASDVPACRELLDGKWGTLVPPHDPEALAAAVISTLRGSRAGDELERSKYLEKFTPAQMIAGYLKASS